MHKYLHGYKQPILSPKEIREHLHVTNNRMAQILGVSLPTWFAWQAGKRQPSAAATRLLDILLWLYEDGRLPLYWVQFAEPRVLRGYAYQDDKPDPLRIEY